MLPVNRLTKVGRFLYLAGMFEVKEQYAHCTVTIEDNLYFAHARQRSEGIVVDFISVDGKLTPIVNGRQLQPYEWKYEECVYKISLKDWV